MANGKILAGRQLKMTFQQGSEAGHWKAVREMLRRYSPHISPSLAAKMILMELSEISKANQSLGPLEACRALGGLRGTSGDLKAPCPDHARSRVPIPEKKEEKKEEREERVKRASPRLCPLPVAEKIIAALNASAGSGFRASGRQTRELIQARLNDGYTVDDFLIVIRKKSAEWRGTEMAGYLRPSTLFSPKFEQYLGQPDGKRARAASGSAQDFINSKPPTGDPRWAEGETFTAWKAEQEEKKRNDRANQAAVNPGLRKAGNGAGNGAGGGYATAAAKRRSTRVDPEGQGSLALDARTKGSEDA